MREPSQTNAPVVEVQDLHVEFPDAGGTVRAVEGANLQIWRGRTLGVVGESGCGKSVTARAILRILDKPGRITGGRILLRSKAGERDLVRLPASGAEMRAIRGREIALVFQEPMTSFSPAHTIGNQIVEMIRLHKKVTPREARELAIEQLVQVGTPHPAHILDQFAWELSGGLRQRAMIAMALVCGPQVLIADEPTTALDVTTQAQVLELVRNLQASRDMGLMLITHDLGVIAETADEVAVMYLGAVVEQGPVDAIFHDPRHPYTQALLRSMPSLLAKPRTQLNTLKGSVPHPLHRPAGCAFHPRCPVAVAGVCDQEAPARTQVDPVHSVSCHRAVGEVASAPAAIAAAMP